MIWSTIIFLITITILVTFHEYGHFIIARLCGVRVEQFSIGFGRNLWSYISKKNGTKFSISLIPLGGYVKMLDGRSSAHPLSDTDINFAFNHKSIAKRAAIILAGPVANFLLALIIYWIIFQIGVVRYPVTIDKILPNTPAATIIIPPQSELKAINDFKIESWSDVNSALIAALGNDIVNIEYQTQNKDIYQQSINIVDWHFDIEKESAITAFGFQPAKVIFYPTISKIISDSAAELAGLKVGDEIVTYNNIQFDNWDNFSAQIRTAKPINLGIKRDNQLLFIDLEPKQELDHNGQLIGIAGIYPSNNTTVKQYDIVSAFLKGSEQTISTMRIVMRSFYQLMSGALSIKSLSGPVGIAQSAGQSAHNGMISYLYFLAFISISLGIMNLLPLPILDGGHLLFLLIEKLKGSPLTDAQQNVFYRIGFLFLIILLGIALFNDFIRLL
ncbi:RIP metalloprotease RseP [Frischella perrara]|uniref:RIP metalloprotease RseP n=1 Tax=Frischella perrara TaxID=1267021 RepID=UPI0023EFF767|nr:RIP metalloprotease RseP [Frischella perrara]